MPVNNTPASGAPVAAPRRPRWVKFALILSVLLTLVLLARGTGLTAWLSVDNVRALMERLGPWGMLAMVGLFVGGTLLNIPPMLFVFASILSYGKWVGAAVSMVGALAGMAVNFWLVRRVGGSSSSADIKNKWVRRALERVETHPFSTVFILRMIVQLLPAMNTTLALTSVSFRHFMLGSAAALGPMMVGLALAFDWVYARVQG